MEIKDPGHKYLLDQRGIQERQEFWFPDMECTPNTPGTTTQEVLRMLIDRTQYCNACLPWTGNEYIIHHLRMALVLHEARALIRKVETHELEPELVTVGHDGHFELTESIKPSKYAYAETAPTDTGSGNPGVVCRTTRAKV